MKTESANWSEPVLAVLRDPQNAPLSRQIPIGLVLSLLAHLLIVGLAFVREILLLLLQLLIAFLMMLQVSVPQLLTDLQKFLKDEPPPLPKIEFARSKPKLKPLEIELVPLPPEPPKLFTLSERDKPEYLDSTGLAKVEKPPEKPTFESDQDMIAAGMNAPTGAAPLPSMGGRKDMSFTNFKTQNALLGVKPELFPDIALAATPTPATPIYKPQPVPQRKPDQPKPAEPEKAPANLRDDLKEVEMPNEHQFPVPKKKPPTPTPEPIMPPAKPQPSTELAKLVPPAPKPAEAPKPAYQPDQLQTKIEGSISNRGAASVDAVKTPLGVFKKKISEAIGSRWHYYMKQQNDLVTVGLARVTFFVTKDGRVQDVRVIDNSSNDIFAFACKRSILEAELPPAPPEAFDAMKDERMEITFTFNLYPN